MEIANSSRLKYRLMDSSDAEALFQLDQDPQVMKFINGGKVSTEETIATVLIPRMERFRDVEQGWGLWHISISATNEYIGWVLVRPMNFFSDQPEFNNLELGWRFFQSSWGKGYASEAAQHIKNHLAKNKQYKTFCAIADENNFGSIGVMKNLDMSYLKTYFHKDPLFETNVVYYQVSND